MSVDAQLEGGQSVLSDAQQGLNSFWPKVTEEIRQLTQTDMRQQELPLARIKRIMKLDEDVKMISAEAPVLFSKAAEIFISELTLRAWIHTEDNKRRTLQHYFQIAQHYQAVLQQSTGNSSNSSQTSNQQQTTAPQTIQIVQAGQVSNVQTTGTTVVSTAQPQQQTPQIIQVQPQTQAQTNPAQASSGGGIQIIQQIIGPDGQIQQIPIQLTPQQLQMIRLQMSGATQQPIIIQTAPIQAVSQQAQTGVSSQPQIIQLQQTGGQPVYITQNQAQQQ
ncbi:nuclear transcription factor Y subunit gamma-like isoform X5 [Macrobrachium rosenbergii]